MTLPGTRPTWRIKTRGPLPEALRRMANIADRLTEMFQPEWRDPNLIPGGPGMHGQGMQINQGSGDDKPTENMDDPAATESSEIKKENEDIGHEANADQSEIAMSNDTPPNNDTEVEVTEITDQINAQNPNQSPNPQNPSQLNNFRNRNNSQNNSNHPNNNNNNPHSRGGRGSSYRGRSHNNYGPRNFGRGGYNNGGFNPHQGN